MLAQFFLERFQPTCNSSTRRRRNWFASVELCKEIRKKNYLSFKRPENADTESHEKRVRFGLPFLSLPLSSRERRKRRWRRRNSNRLAATSHFSSRGGADEVGEPRHYPPLYLYSYAEHRSAITIPGTTDPATNSGGNFSLVKIQRELVNLPHRFSEQSRRALANSPSQRATVSFPFSTR